MTLIEHETQRMVQIANPKKLRVRTGPTFAHCWLAPRLAEFCSESPQIDLLVTTNVGEVDSSEDHFDVAIHMMHDPLTGDSELLFSSRSWRCATHGASGQTHRCGSHRTSRATLCCIP